MTETESACDTADLVFQGIPQGTVILGDQYSPGMVDRNWKCIPVLRIVDATFKELGNHFANKSKGTGQCRLRREFLSCSGDCISAKSDLNLGIEGYIQEFLVF